jgi:hypothetical protein
MDQKRTLSEISHLFLSEVRQRQTGGAPAPRRIAPSRKPPVSIEMTPAEFAATSGGKNDLETSPAAEAGLDDTVAAIDSDSRPEPGIIAAAQSDSQKQQSPGGGDPSAAEAGMPRVSVVLGAHLIDHPAERIRQYARHIASIAGHVGLIEADSAEFGLTCFESGGGASADPLLLDELDSRRISEMLAELAFDVDRWIVSLPNPKTSEARQLLRAAPHWVLLTTADHDGVVATYRALKGLAELGRPRLSLVVLDARDEAQANAVFRKLDAVSRQFLGCQMEPADPVRPVGDVAEHVVLHCRSTHDKAQLASAPQWEIVGNFLNNSAAPAKDDLCARESINVESDSDESASAESEFVEVISEKSNESKWAGPETISPEPIAPEVILPEAIAPEAVMPETIAPKVFEPRPIAPKPIELEVSENARAFFSAAPSEPQTVEPTSHMKIEPSETSASKDSQSSSPGNFGGGFATSDFTSPRMSIARDDMPEVIDLVGDPTPDSILQAVVRQGGLGGDWVQCPIKAPMCPDAVLAVGRDQRLMLLAVTGRGLTELRSIGLALRWMSENRQLLRMAFPQLAINIEADPAVRLLVDHSDLSAELLQPLLQASTVTVQAYRKLKWGQKTGLLLEAA